MAFDLGLRRMKDLIFSRDGEALQLAVARFQTAASVFEAERDLAAFDLHRLIARAGVNDLLTISDGSCSECQPGANWLFLGRMNFAITVINAYGHRRLRQALHR